MQKNKIFSEWAEKKSLSVAGSLCFTCSYNGRNKCTDCQVSAKEIKKALVQARRKTMAERVKRKRVKPKSA